MSKAKIWNYVCVAMMAVLLILQFMPFWSYGDQSTSIQTYVWFPSDHNALTDYLTAELGDGYAINEIVLAPIMIVLTTVAGIVFCLIKSDVPIVKLIPIVGGVIGIWGFLAKPALQLGSTWVIQLLLCIGMVATAVISMVTDFKEEVNC